MKKNRQFADIYCPRFRMLGKPNKIMSGLEGLCLYLVWTQEYTNYTTLCREYMPFSFICEPFMPALLSFVSCNNLFHSSAPFPSPSFLLPVRSSSTETCSGTFSRWSFHGPPHQTSSRSAWSCRSFSLSNSTPASGPSPPGALAPTCPPKPLSSTLTKELQSFVSMPRSILLGECWAQSVA